jgi:predicted dehydrogenase
MHIGIIGVGDWGKKQLRVLNILRSEGLINEITICDENLARAKRLATNFEIERYFTNYSDLFKKDNIDAISVVTPTETHYKITKEILNHQIPVFVEKPLSFTSKECAELINLSKENGTKLVVGHIFRHHKAINEVKKMIERRDFGRIFLINNSRITLRTPRERANVLFELGIHDVDIPCFLLDLDAPESILATASKHFIKNEDTATIHMRFPENIDSFAFESWIIPVYGKKRELTVIGSDMSVKVDYLKHNELKIYDQYINPQSLKAEHTQTPPDIKYLEDVAPLEAEIREFIDCVIDKNKKPIADMYVGKRAVEAIEKCHESIRTGNWISF